MIFPILAALALSVDATPNSAGTPLQSNLEYADPAPGAWTYTATSDGSEATFADAAGQPQVTIRCTRSTRHVAILKPAAAASRSLWIWTSSESKSVPATFDAAAGRVSSAFGAYDPLLDAMASSRGRIGISASGLAALVVPPWAEVGRVIEDCRV